MGNGCATGRSNNKVQAFVPPEGSEPDSKWACKVEEFTEAELNSESTKSSPGSPKGPNGTKIVSNDSTKLPGSCDLEDASPREIVSNVGSGVAIRKTGESGTTSYALRFSDTFGNDISPWHDIPLNTDVDQVFNIICEIPKMTKPKFEVATKEPQNPIKQDIKKGKLREYHGPIFWNYGMFPQTWEDPNEEHPIMKCCGDNDPLDVVEIGARAFQQGSIVPVKVLGALAMLDEGEVDWKIIAISNSDPLAAELHDIEDVETKCPGVISGIREWFRWYKTPDGKSLNSFGYQGNALGREEALSIVAETHQAWKQLKAGGCPSGGLWVN